MEENKRCPGCGRHCDLSQPHCERGVEYARTGELPQGREKGRRGEGCDDRHGDRREGCGRREGHERHEGYERHEGRCKRMLYGEQNINDKLIDSLRALNRLMRAQYEGKAGQQRILMMLNITGPMTQRELTEQLDVQPGSASEILSKLENGGLILRTPNETDRRTTDVQLTEEGRALAAEAVDKRRERHEEMFSCLSEEEKETFLSLLEKVREDWKSRYREDRGGRGRQGEGHGRRGPRGPRGPRGERQRD